MPVLHEYRSKRGMYVKARHGRSMVTYQLAPGAATELRRLGLGDGSKVSPDALHILVEAGLAYTHGSGAGVVEATPPPSPPVYRYTPPASPPLSQSFTPLPLPPSLPSTRPATSSTHRPWLGYACTYQEAKPQPSEQPVASPEVPTPPTVTLTPTAFVSRPVTPVRRIPTPPTASLAPTNSPLAAPHTTSELLPEPIDWWRLVGKAWAAITYEPLGIPMWLWLFMLVGVLVPTLLIGSVIGQQ